MPTKNGVASAVNPFWPFVPLLAAVGILAVALFLAIGTIAPVLRSLDQTIERQERLNKAMLLGTVNQARNLVEQERGLRLAKELNRQLGALAGEDDGP